jgi:hypothetical protein
MKCAGFDLARHSGYALGERTGAPVYGAFELPGFDEGNLARSLGSLYTNVRGLIAANGVEGVAIEAPQTNIRRTNARGITTPTSKHGTTILTMLSGVARAAAFNAGAKHIWLVDPSVWRKAVYGNGYPDNPKAAAISYCRQVYKVHLTDDNIAEGLALLSYAHGQARLL